MLCNNCGYQTTDKIRFCPQCGYQMSLEAAVKNRQAQEEEHSKLIEKYFREVFDMPGEFGRKTYLLGQQPIESHISTQIKEYLAGKPGKVLLVCYDKNIYSDSIVVTTKELICRDAGRSYTIPYGEIKAIQYEERLFTSIIDITFHNDKYLLIRLPVVLDNGRRFVEYIKAFFEEIAPLFSRRVETTKKPTKRIADSPVTYYSLLVNPAAYVSFKDVFPAYQCSELFVFERNILNRKVESLMEKYILDEDELPLAMFTEYDTFLLTDRYFSWNGSSGFTRIELTKIKSVNYRRIVLASAMEIVDQRNRKFTVFLTGLPNPETFVETFENFLEEMDAYGDDSYVKIEKIGKLSAYELLKAYQGDVGTIQQEDVEAVARFNDSKAEYIYYKPEGEKAICLIDATGFFDDNYSKGLAIVESGLYYISENYGHGYMGWDDFANVQILNIGDVLTIGDIAFRHVKNGKSVIEALKRVQDLASKLSKL